jgi:hypothetical protein
VDFYRLTTFYRQFPNRASTSRTSGLRLGRVGIIGWPLQKLLLPLHGQSSKTRFYNMLGKEDQSRNWGSKGFFQGSALSGVPPVPSRKGADFGAFGIKRPDC